MHAGVDPALLDEREVGDDAQQRNQADAAVRLAGATAAQRQALGAVLWPSERRYVDAWLAHARRTLGPNAYQRARDDGQASTSDQAVSLAEVLSVQPQAVGALPAALSPREQEVAILLARGVH